jgi:uncharacterized protein YcaQ
MKLSQRDARKLFMNQQGLLRENEFGRGKNAVLKAINRLSYLQIDTISVVDRAHLHVMSSRITNFDSGHLDKLTGERNLYEYWSHAAAYLPFESYRFSIPVMKGWHASRQCDRALAKKVMDRIRLEGPLQSRDFEDNRARKSTGWWQWKPAKQVLEHLFLSGELMVTRREGFQKVFDLKENVIPSHIDTREPNIEQWSRHIVLNMIKALGVASEYDLGYAKPTIRRLAKVGLKEPIKHTISTMLRDGELIEVTIDGRTCYTTNKFLEALPLRAHKKLVKILSPFDNLVINRRRIKELFGFDYQLECYLPAEKRRYGYFSLPLLYGDALIGRLDAKAERSNKRLQINNLALEPAVLIDDQLIGALARGIAHFSSQNHCVAVNLSRCSPNHLKLPLTNELERHL